MRSGRIGSKISYAWKFTFKVAATGRLVTSGVIETEFGKAKRRALSELAAELGVDGRGLQFVGYKRSA